MRLVSCLSYCRCVCVCSAVSNRRFVLRRARHESPDPRDRPGLAGGRSDVDQHPSVDRGRHVYRPTHRRLRRHRRRTAQEGQSHVFLNSAIKRLLTSDVPAAWHGSSVVSIIVNTRIHGDCSKCEVDYRCSYVCIPQLSVHSATRRAIHQRLRISPRCVRTKSIFRLR